MCLSNRNRFVSILYILPIFIISSLDDTILDMLCKFSNGFVIPNEIIDICNIIDGFTVTIHNTIIPTFYLILLKLQHIGFHECYLLSGLCTKYYGSKECYICQ